MSHFIHVMNCSDMLLLTCTSKMPNPISEYKWVDEKLMGVINKEQGKHCDKLIV